MEKRFNYVYLTTNKINGKQYVGDHGTNELNDGYVGSGRIFKKALQKYGIENFEVKILEQFEDKQQAFDAQEKYIQQYNTLIPNGYNVSPKGGHNVFGCWNDISKEKMKVSVSKKLKGRVFTEEWKQKLKDAKKDFKPWNVGKPAYEWTPEMRKKASDRSKISNNFKSIHQLYDKWLENHGKEIADKKLKEWKEKMSTSLLGKEHKLITVICPFCKKEGKGPNMTRYHFNNCKHKK